MNQRRVLVEMRVPHWASNQWVREMAGQLEDHGFDWDEDYLVPIKERRRHRYVLLRGEIEEGREPELEAQPDVIRVWSDAPIIEYEEKPSEEESFDLTF